MTKEIISIKGHQYEVDKLSTLQSTDIKVSWSGRRFVVQDVHKLPHQLKYNTLLKAVLRSELNLKTKATLLKSLLPLQNSGRKQFWFLKNHLIDAKQAWGKAKQQQYIQEAQKLISKDIAPKKTDKAKSSSEEELSIPKKILEPRKDRHLGIFSKIFETLPQEMIFHIIDQLSLNTPYEIQDAIQKMRWFLKVKPEELAVFHSIPAALFADWMIRHNLRLTDCFLSENDTKTLAPLLHPAHHIKPPSPILRLFPKISQNIKASFPVADKEPKILGSVSPQDFAKWMNISQVPLKEIELTQEELAAVIPYLTTVNINFKKNPLQALQALNLINPQMIKKLEIAYDTGSLETIRKKLKDFPQLETLCLRGNDELPSSFLYELHQLPKLLSLNLSQAHFNPNLLIHYPYPLNLKTLLIDHFPERIEKLMKFQNLQILKFPTGIVDYSPEKTKVFFNQLTHLKELNARACQITGIEFKNCNLANTLKKLDLSLAKQPLQIECLKSYAQLESLDLNFAKFALAELKTVLQSCPQLKNLYLSDTEITGAEFENCASAGTLKILFLNGCKKLNPEYIKYLHQFTYLKRLVIRKLSLPAEMHAQLQEALPLCEINAV